MTVATEKDPDSAPAGVELKRVFQAPRERVFEAWTYADALAAWFGPVGLSTRIDTFDPRGGGRYRFLMHGEGEYPVGGEFLEIVPPERLSFTFAWERGDYAGVETIVEVTLEETAGETELTLVHRRWLNDEACDKHRQGWTSSFNCLAEFLAREDRS